MHITPHRPWPLRMPGHALCSGGGLYLNAAAPLHGGFAQFGRAGSGSVLLFCCCSRLVYAEAWLPSGLPSIPAELTYLLLSALHTLTTHTTMAILIIIVVV